jgi:hypothetical protein
MMKRQKNSQQQFKYLLDYVAAFTAAYPDGGVEVFF